MASSGYAVEASADFRTAVPFGKMPPRTLSPIEGLVNLGAEPQPSVFAGKKVARAWYVRASVGAGLKAQMGFTRPAYGGLVVPCKGDSTSDWLSSALKELGAPSYSQVNRAVNAGALTEAEVGLAWIQGKTGYGYRAAWKPDRSKGLDLIQSTEYFAAVDLSQTFDGSSNAGYRLADNEGLRAWRFTNSKEEAVVPTCDLSAEINEKTRQSARTFGKTYLSKDLSGPATIPANFDLVLSDKRPLNLRIGEPTDLATTPESGLPANLKELGNLPVVLRAHVSKNSLSGFSIGSVGKYQELAVSEEEVTRVLSSLIAKYGSPEKESIIKEDYPTWQRTTTTLTWPKLRWTSRVQSNEGGPRFLTETPPRHS